MLLQKNAQLHLMISGADLRSFKNICNAYGFQPSEALRYIIHRCVKAKAIPGIKPIKHK